MELATGGGVQMEIFQASYVIFSLSCRTHDRGGECKSQIFPLMLYRLFFKISSLRAGGARILAGGAGRGGQDFSRGGRAPMGPPHATGLYTAKIKRLRLELVGQDH